MYVKICGITQPDDALAIARLGADALGFICVERSPRFVSPDRLAALTANLPATVQRIGVWLDAPYDRMVESTIAANLTGIQLHGNESPEECDRLREAFPHHLLIKALRVRDRRTLDLARTYESRVDVLLLDTYDPHQAGGTGKTLDWHLLRDFQPRCAWWLAGGLTPDNAAIAIAHTQPHGIDLSSGVEQRPGIKDLKAVRRLLQAVRSPSVEALPSQS